jgi:hypothetical protein
MKMRTPAFSTIGMLALVARAADTCRIDLNAKVATCEYRKAVRAVATAPVPVNQRFGTS